MLKQQIRNILRKPHQIPRRIANKLSAILTNFILNKKCRVKFQGKTTFTMRDFGEITKMRIVTFETKEPETLNWINGFEKDDTLLDIGANVGIYSLYAAARRHQVASIEPNALNFALLNLNILDNGIGDRITAYPYSVHSNSKISLLNNGLYQWGGAVSTFDRNLDSFGNGMVVNFKQGSPGISVDDFLKGTGFFPSHIKIDVDGNELLVLQGATHVLNNPRCKSVLIELFDDNSEHEQCIEVLKKSGFVLSHVPIYACNTIKAGNYIFTRQ